MTSVFPDVVFHRGSVWICYREDPRVPGRLVVERDGAIVLTIDLPAESPCFPRLHQWAGGLWLAYHDGRRGYLRSLDPAGSDRVLEPCENNDPICFGFRWVAWQGAARDGWPVTRLNLETGEVVERVRNGQGTGLSRVLANGTVTTIDEDRFGVAGHTRPDWDGDLAVAEGHNNRGIFWRLNDGRQGVIWPEIQVLTPKCAVDHDSVSVAIVGWGGRPDISRWIGTRQELAALAQPQPPPVPVPPTPQPPTPQPQPTPEPTPVPENNGIENGVLVNPKNYFLTLVQGKPAGDYERVFREIEEDLYRYGLGFQTRSDGTPTSRIYLPTTICPNAAPQTPEDRKLGVKQDPKCWSDDVAWAGADTVDGSGPTAKWTWVERGHGTYQPLRAVPTPPQPPAPPAPPQPPSDDLKALKADVAALKAENAAVKEAFAKLTNRIQELAGTLAELTGKVSTLEQRPQPSPTLPSLRVKGRTRTMWGHQHDIDLIVEPQ